MIFHDGMNVFPGLGGLRAASHVLIQEHIFFTPDKRTATEILWVPGKSLSTFDKTETLSVNVTGGGTVQKSRQSSGCHVGAA